MYKVEFSDCLIHTKVRGHLEIRNRMLQQIAEVEEESLCVEDGYYSDSIAKLDWHNAKDFNRPWVRTFDKHYKETIAEAIDSMAYTAADMKSIWFQQYLEDGGHGWHIHGQHYTGVYYLEYSDGCGKTEICSPYNLKRMQIDVKEGDMIIFPAHWIHRGTANGKNRKTIISFNFDIIADKLNLMKL